VRGEYKTRLEGKWIEKRRKGVREQKVGLQRELRENSVGWNETSRWAVGLDGSHSGDGGRGKKGKKRGH